MTTTNLIIASITTSDLAADTCTVRATAPNKSWREFNVSRLDNGDLVCDAGKASKSAKTWDAPTFYDAQNAALEAATAELGTADEASDPVGGNDDTDSEIEEEVEEVVESAPVVRARAPKTVKVTLLLPTEIASLEFWTGDMATGFSWNGLNLVPVDGGWSVQAGATERRAETMDNVPYLSPRRAIAALRVLAKR